MAIKRFVELMEEPPTKVMLMGPALSDLAAAVAPAVPHWNLFQVKTTSHAESSVPSVVIAGGIKAVFSCLFLFLVLMTFMYTYNGRSNRQVLRLASVALASISRVLCICCQYNRSQHVYCYVTVSLSLGSVFGTFSACCCCYCYFLALLVPTQ